MPEHATLNLWKRQVFGDGRYCVDSTLGLKRVRITRTSLEAAKIEGRKLIAQIAAGRHQEEPLSIAETEDYRMAIAELKPHKISLLTVVAEWKACARHGDPVGLQYVLCRSCSPFS